MMDELIFNIEIFYKKPNEKELVINNGFCTKIQNQNWNEKQLKDFYKTLERDLLLEIKEIEQTIQEQLQEKYV